MEIFTDPQALQEFIGGFGLWAPAVFFLVQVIQVIVSLIPGNVTTLVGGALFGFAKGFIISAAAIVVGSLLAFALARRFGPLLVRKLAGEKLYDRYQHLITSNTAVSRVRLTLAVTMLLPFFPDDIICLLAGLSALRFRDFCLIILLFRPWGLLFSALVGSGALAVPLWAMVAISAVSIALGLLSARFAPQLEAWAMRILQKITARFHPDGEDN